MRALQMTSEMTKAWNELLKQTNEDLRHSEDLWRRRAERTRGENDALRERVQQLYDDNVRLSTKLSELAAHPLVLHAPQPDLAPILDMVRRTLQPDVVIHSRPDAPDEQRAGINWQHQGLDNNAGVPEDVSDPLLDTRPSIPDYVLDIESIDPDKVKGSRGGWYNP
jgi:hypothetical protein